MPNQVIQYSEIRKSMSDFREYRGLKLKNDLKVLLISDPNTDISATSLAVAVGSLSDPKGFPGLAHLCEHMLFRGTKKYPVENEFSQFITKNGGRYCAYTSNDYTNYYCSSKTDALRPLLDRFSRFFIEPLFTESSVEKEINAIDSEHEKNKADDDWRLKQLKKSLAAPNHPFNHFGAGNKETLWDIPKGKKKNVCHELLKFYSKWYSSHLMNLAVLGKEDLNTLEEMVVSLFKDIKKKDISMPTWVNPIYKEEQLGTKTIVVPVKDIRQLHVDFLLKDQKSFYKSMPTDYLNALFSDKGPYSISAILIRNGWSTGALAGNSYEARGIEYYEIYAELTDFGLGHVDDIVMLIFQYVNMLKQNGPVQWFHGETKDIKTMDFCFKDKEPPLVYVYTLTPQMIRYEMSDVLIAENLIEDWKPKLIKELLTYFTPGNMRITVVSKAYKDQTNAVDKYYGTQYSVFKIPEKTLKNWRDAGYCKDLKLPLSNQYVAQNYSLVPIEPNEPEVPQLFHNTSIMRVWLKTDTVFRLPKAYISIEFYSPIVAMDPFNCNIMDIFVRLFNEHFSLHACFANRAVLNTTMKSRAFGFNMKFNGFNHKMHHLMKKTIEKLFTFKIDPKRLEIVKEEKIRELNNMDMEQPFHSAMRYSSLILSEVAWSPFELLRFFHNINAKVVRHFVDNFLKHMFIEAILYGNLDNRMASLLIHQLKQACLLRGGFRPLVPREMIRSREVEMNDGESVLYEHVSSYHSSSCVYINLQCGVQSTKNNIMVSLFNQIIEESCLNILRTQEQLGYLVKSRTHKSNGVLYICILVQSERDPTFVHARIEHYLSTVEGLLKDLSETEFNDNKESLSIKLAEKPKGQIEQAKVYRSEIINQSYNFNRVEIEIEELKLITKKDIIDFYNEKISHTGPKRRKLAVHVKSKMNDMIDKLKTSSKITVNNDSFTTMNVQKINDIIEFKRSHRLHPVPKSFTPIGSNGIEYPDDTDFTFYEVERLRRRNEMSAASSFSS